MDTFTWIHVAVGTVGIATGCFVVWGLRYGLRLDGWTAVFLLTTLAASLTGFGFPFRQFLPAHAVGIVSLVVLPLAIAARYFLRLSGIWRTVYVVCAVAALYLNVVVLVAQAFMKVPALNALAPTITEWPFVAAQVVLFGLFSWIGIAALRAGATPARLE